MWEKILSAFVSFIMVFTTFMGTTLQKTVHAQSNTNSNVTIERLAGVDRYKTAVEICKKGWKDKSDYVVLANGENFPDALSAAPLAKKYNAPILLTSKDVLNEDTKSELQRLNVKQVLIVGGSGVISENVESTLNSMNITVKRFYGKDRYETSIKVAEEVELNNNGVFVANGENFPDALSVAPIAAQKGMPIILVPKDNLTESTDKYVSSNSITKSYVIGNSNSISESIVSKFKNTERIYGQNRYATNVAVIEKFENDLNFSGICVANGENFPDGLSGSALAALNKEPILLVTEETDESTEALVNKKNSLFREIRVFGGEGVVSNWIPKRIRSNFQDISDINPLTLSKNVVDIDTGEVAGVYKELESIKSNANGNKVITLKDTNTALNSFKSGDIFFMEPTKENPLGCMAKVVSNTEAGDGKNVIEVTEPLLNEVISQASFDIEKTLDEASLISTDLPEGTTVSFKETSANENKNNILASLNSDNIGQKKTRIFKDLEINVGDTKLVDTNYVEVKTAGKIVFKNPKVTTAFDFNNGGHFKVQAKVKGELSKELDMNYKVNGKIEGGSFNKDKNENELLWNARLKGVDLDKKYILGSLTFSCGNVPVKGGVGGFLGAGKLPKNIPLGITVFLTLTLDGEVSTEVNFNVKSSSMIDAGIDTEATNKNVGNSKSIEDTYTMKGDFSGNLDFGVGPMVGIVAGGLILADVYADLILGVDGKWEGDIEITQNDIKQNSSLEGNVYLKFIGGGDAAVYVEIGDDKAKASTGSEISFTFEPIYLLKKEFTTKPKPVDWKLLYREKLKEILPEYGDLAALIDINLDGTPELLIGYPVGSGGFSEAYCAYTIKNGSLVSILRSGSSFDIEDIDSSKLYYNSSTNKYQIVSESYVQNGAFYRIYSTYIYNLNNDILSQTEVIGRVEDEQIRGNIKYTYMVSGKETNETEYTQAKANLYNGWKEVGGFGVALKQVTSSINDINNFLDSYTSSININ